ncbi:MAG: terminase family protein [Eikenella sp.]|nr:terminase family protein [Eikenella sp.]
MNLPEKFKAFVSGYGSGKTWVGCAGIAKHLWEHPKINAGYFAPTYPQIRDIFYPTIEEVAFDWGLQVEIRESNKEAHFFSAGRYRGTVICRSMDNPASIVGFKIGHALCDEIDTMKRDKAREAWRKIIARMRYKVDGLRNGIDVTTTPEGFQFVYEQFVKAVRENPELGKLYGLIQASTYDNAANLPDDYIASLKASYPPQLIEAYLNGQFVNLNSGTVYSNFDREKNHTDAEMEHGEALHIGMDFNVLKMAAVVYVIRGGNPYAVAELTDVRDTPTMADLLKELYAGRAITIYPDASGQNRSSKNWSQSDISILKQAGFVIRVDSTNPSVKDRVNSTQAMLLNGNGERRLKVNTRNCPKLTEAMEQQVYDNNGEPDKTSGHDHVTDAGTYPIVKLYPIKKPAVGRSDFLL